jgi:hypothetical protein
MSKGWNLGEIEMEWDGVLAILMNISAYVYGMSN